MSRHRTACYDAAEGPEPHDLFPEYAVMSWKELRGYIEMLDEFYRPTEPPPPKQRAAGSAAGGSTE